ncbi:MAG: methionine adenosyltransferase [Clostridia bacterium]|nr:methionine adenosyltransferase [Clostridia bacterium]MBR2328154.1 methionine adenosyltransferase [Clostridia bacterium]
MNRKLFTSESVTEGHPDKICDQISDSVLDEIISKDPFARVACEATATTGLVNVFGEITTSCYVDIPKIVRKVIRDIGYNDLAYGFSADTCGINTSIDEQSPDISDGVSNALEGRADDKQILGAGDQGMMFGYACDETPELMPLPIQKAHELAKQLAKVRKEGILPFLRPDGKTQVTVEYDEKGNPVRIDTIVVSTQHDDGVSNSLIEEAIIKEVISKVIDPNLLDRKTKYFINPSGRFVIGGPVGDSGLTGRKIIVDTYGGMGSHGGGAFSGKDPTKVDRSAAYAARNVAKTIVAAGLARRVEVQLAYAIGVAEPVSVSVNTFGTGRVSDFAIADAVKEVYDLRPGAIINYFDLRKPIYSRLAAYGHMGREDLGVSFEKITKKDELLKAIK